MLLNSFTPSISRAVAVTTMLAATVACAPRASETPVVTSQGQALGGQASTPVLLSCPAGQQSLMRQVLVNGAAVPQVECVTAGAVAMTAAPAMVPAAQAPMYAAAPAASSYASPVPVTYQPVVPVAAAPRAVARPQARRVAYDDDIVEYKRPSKRSWQKSAAIIGVAAGAGAGVGAATGGKKGALIGAAVGGGAATLWDQVTRRQR
jgi:hypothetical protein